MPDPILPTVSAPSIMTSPISRPSLRPELLVPGLNQVFGLGVESIQARVPMAYHVMTSQRAFEEMLSMAGIGYFERWLEGQPFHYQSIESRFKSRFTHLDYVTGLRFTRKVMDDELYGQMREATMQFGMAATATQEELGALTFNNGDSTLWNAEANENFFSATHALSTRAVGGVTTYSNLVSGDPDFDTIQEAIILLENTPNDMGYPMHMKATHLFYHPENEFLVDEWLNSPGRYDSPNLAKNTLKGRLIPVAWDYLDTDIMLVRGSQYKTYWFNRKGVSTSSETDFDTEDLKYKASFSCSNGVADWRGWVMIKG